jgi:hypothetical protein
VSDLFAIRVEGVSAVQHALSPFLQPELDRHLYAALKPGAMTFKREVAKEARPASMRMSKAARYRKAKRDKPGYVIGFKRKKAYFAHMVIGGTKDHGPRKADALVFVPGWNPYGGASSRGVGGSKGGWVRASRVSGVKPNPIVERAASRADAAVTRQVEAALAKETGL